MTLKIGEYIILFENVISEKCEELLSYMKYGNWIGIRVDAASSICNLSKRVTTFLAMGNFFLIEFLQTVSREKHIQVTLFIWKNNVQLHVAWACLTSHKNFYPRYSMLNRNFSVLLLSPFMYVLEKKSQCVCVQSKKSRSPQNMAT